MMTPWDPIFLDETLRELREDSSTKVTVRVYTPGDGVRLRKALAERGATDAELARLKTYYLQ